MMPTQFHRPTELAQACALLAQDPADTAVLGGGTDLLVRMRAGVRRPRHLLDIKALPGIAELAWNEAGGVRLGAALTMHRLAHDERLRAAYPALAIGAGEVGSLQIRQRATLGGNLANASPCMDTAPGLIVYGASFVAVSSQGERRIPSGEFFKGAGKNALQPGEILVAIEIPPPGKRSSVFGKIKRTKGHDLALVNMAMALDPEAGRITLTVGSCAAVPVPVVIDDLGGGLDAVAERAASLAVARIAPINDVRASAEYRRDMTAFLARSLTRQLLTAGRTA